MTLQDYKEGQVILINKPLEWSSFGIVSKVRNLICKKYGIKKLKVGHAGTLDPLATGLLILCTGKKTKEIDLFQAQEKEYIAKLTFGGITPSYDAETDVTESFDYSGITVENLRGVLDTFTGDILQVPPIYSAKYIDGKRAYSRARNGEEISLPARNITIHSIEILKFELPIVELKVSCGKGTYIRSLAFDIGKALNSGAYLSGLERTKIGEFRNEDAISIVEFEKNIKTEQ